MMQHSILIAIPARMASSRLPNKPLADIAGLPMIVQVMKRANEAGIGDVMVACDGEEIATAVRAAGGTAIVTDANLPSGSDRIWAALETLAAKPDIIINLQGDLPTFESSLLLELVETLVQSGCDIATIVTPITEESEHTNPSVVKAVVSLDEGEKTGRALYFTRATAPYGEGVRYHHIGVYAYRYEALKHFVALPPSTLEQREKLEQLRALEAGMRIAVCVADTPALGVDTPQDLERAREILAGTR